MPGQMGNKRRTQRGLEIAEVDTERNLLLVKGSVPGSRNAVLEVRSDG
jgi:large subunit ribosomal protein L3